MKFFVRSCWLVFLLAAVLQGPVFAGGPLSTDGRVVQESKDVQLNVVFHGLFSYIIWPDHVEVLVPMVDDHVYKAGTWGREFRLREGVVYHLDGVHAEARIPEIDMRNNLVLTKVSKIDRSPERIFCSFILPLPRQIIGLRLASSPPNHPTFQGKALNGTNPDSIPLVQAMIYSVESQPNLGKKFPWVPEDNGSGAINLHIWAEPEVDMPEGSHPMQAFSRLMAIFPDVDLQLAFGASALPDKATHVRGLKPWEERSLVERSKLLFPPKPQKPAISKGTEVSNCVGMIVVNTGP